MVNLAEKQWHFGFWFAEMGSGGRDSNKKPAVGVTSVHKRSKSFPDKRGLEEKEDNLDHFLEASHQPKLILQLEQKLQDQVVVRSALEKALGYRSSSHDITNEVSMPKPATELIREISVLEMEVVHIEQYLLSLYRKAFDQQSSPLTKDDRLKSPPTHPRGRYLPVSKSDITPRESSTTQATCPSLANPRNEHSNIREEMLVDPGVQRCHSSLSQWSVPLTRTSPPEELPDKAVRVGEEMLVDPGVQRCHSSLSQWSVPLTRTSPPEELLDKAVRACYSQPLSMMEYAQNASSNLISLAEHLGTRISDHVHVPETPNKLSEDMIKCMSAIYCKLANPPLTNQGFSSPNSFLSSTSAFSPKDQCDMWSPRFRKDSSFDVRLDNPFHVEGLKEFSGPYSTMVEVPCIYRDSLKLGDIEDMLQCFRSLIHQLERVDPRKMKNEEKLAFWINIHNALVMHAFLAYGIPQKNIKRVFLLLKAAYNVGGHIVSADTIQNSILGCRMSRPGQWLRLLLASRTKFKAGDARQAFAINHPEPLLHFALCSGSHSDPAVRVYKPKRVLQELEVAKEEYIRATFGIRKDHKILLPKVVESFAKDSGLCSAGVIELIQQYLPESVRKSVKKCKSGKSSKSIEWVPYNFGFRYLISKELVK
ncbi:electron transporter, putative [Actinidia rufa]|uniref:Electron transporter, putative n=1 Tax=Actinidia rufa TaxID=165716 RepID=A0A7J0H6I0_9ERIC|nr:electron transporter, putative [Actinidia rufa]